MREKNSVKELVDFLRELNVQTIVGMVIIWWLLSKHVDKKFEAFQMEFRRESEKQSKRTDHLYEMFIDLVKERQKS